MQPVRDGADSSNMMRRDMGWIESFGLENGEVTTATKCLGLRQGAQERVMTIIVVLAAVALPALVALAFGDPLLTMSAGVIGLAVSVASLLFGAAIRARGGTSFGFGHQSGSGLRPPTTA